MRLISARLVAPCIVILMACGETAAVRQMRQVAGTYEYVDSVGGIFVTRTMTLTPDGKATLTVELALPRELPKTNTATGTYSVGPGTITTRFNQNDLLTYTILADTLFPRLGPRERQIEAMTGRPGGANMGDQRLVRVR